MRELILRFIAFLSTLIVLMSATAGLGQMNQAEPPSFSRPGGLFSESFSLSLSAGAPTQQIRFTLDGTRPTEQSTLYTAPLLIEKTTQLRARTFEAGLSPSQVVSQSYLALGADIRDFSSNLPIVVIDTFGGSIDEINLRPSYTVVVDVGEDGRTHLTGPADYAGRSGVKFRGSSSVTWPKKQHKIEFWDEDDNDLDVSVLSMPSDSDWLLNMPHFDYSLMRNYLPQLWARRMGLYGVRTRYVEVFIKTAVDGGPGGPVMIEDDFTRAAGEMPADPDGKGAPIPTGGHWTNYQLSDRAPNVFDGTTNLEMPRVGDWNQYLDSRRIGLSINPGIDHTFLCTFTMPNAGGSQVLGFAVEGAWNNGNNANSPNHRLFRLRGGSIYFTKTPFSEANDLDTGFNYVPDVPQGLRIDVGGTGAISLWYQNGGDKDPASPAWVDITPAAVPNNLLQMGFGSNMIGVQNIGNGGGTFKLDYIAVLPNVDTGGNLQDTITMGDSYGVYLLMETIKRGDDRINIARVDRTQITEPEISGGYIMRHDRIEPDDTALPFGNGETNTALEIMEPKSHDLAPEHKTWMIDWINTMEAALNGPDSHDPVNGYAKYLDVDSFIDYDIVGQIVKGNDYWRHSMYMHKDREGKLTMGPPWDHDNGLASTTQHEGQNPVDWWRPPVPQRTGLNPWYGWWSRLLEDLDYAQRWCDRWAMLRKGGLSTAQVAADFDHVIELLSEVEVRNSQRWGFSHQTYLNDVTFMENWVHDRMAWFDDQFLTAPAFYLTLPPDGMVEPGFGLTMSAPVGQIYYTLTGSDPRQWAIPGGGSDNPTPPLTLVPESAAKQVLVPTGDIGTAWRNNVNFNDAGWTAGSGGVGYEDGSGNYPDFFQIDVSKMIDTNATCYIRIPFTIATGELEEMDSLTLNVRYDDGFRAYLDGVDVAARQAPAAPEWDSAATTSHDDGLAVVFERFNVSSELGRLSEGDHLLAIHGLNRSVDSSDFLISAELIAGALGSEGGGIAPEAVLYTGLPVTVRETTEVFARTYDGGRWSAPGHELITLDEPATGDVIISEFLANANGDDVEREWVELFNTTDKPIDINGWQLADNDSDVHVIDRGGPLVAPAKGHLVLGASDDPTRNDGASVDYAWGPDEFTLGNGGDEIILSRDGAVIDALGYGDFEGTPTPVTDVGLDARAGLALGMGLDYCEGPVGLWREQSTLYGTRGDTGTPGMVNDGVVVCDADTTPPELLTASLARRDLLLLRFSEPLEPLNVDDPSQYTLEPGGALVVSAELVNPARVLLGLSAPLASEVNYTIRIVEITDLAGNPMNGPQEASVSFQTPPISITEVMYDNRGDDLEWVELYNTTDAPIDLSGWYLSDDESYPAAGEGWVTLPAGTVLGPGDYLVVNLWSDPAFSLWRMPETVSVVDSEVGDSGKLSNGGDNLVLYAAATGGDLIDGSLLAEWPELSEDGESLAKIDERFPWGDPETVTYNLTLTAEPIGFETGLNIQNQTLSDFATPGRPGPGLSFPQNAIGRQYWYIYR